MADYAMTVVEVNQKFIERLTVGSNLIMPTDERGLKFLNRCNNGEIINIDTRKVDSSLKRSYEQLSLYWAACLLTALNTPYEHNDQYSWNTKEKVDMQCKIKSGLIEGYLSYKDENGNDTLQLILGSVSFDNLKHLDACCYFDNAFAVMAEHLQIDVDTLIKETKKAMKGSI